MIESHVPKRACELKQEYHDYLMLRIRVFRG